MNANGCQTVTVHIRTSNSRIMTEKGRQILQRCFQSRLNELNSLNEDGSLSDEIREVEAMRMLNEAKLL